MPQHISVSVLVCVCVVCCICVTCLCLGVDVCASLPSVLCCGCLQNRLRLFLSATHSGDNTDVGIFRLSYTTANTHTHSFLPLIMVVISKAMAPHIQ